MSRVPRATWLALLASAALWIPALARAQPSDDALQPRLFGMVRLGPVGRTTVRADARQLAGSPLAAPGLGARLDLPLNPQLLLGLDAGVLFEANDVLGPNGDEGASINALVADLALALRRVWRIDRGRFELSLSIGAGVSARSGLSGEFPLTDPNGATRLEYVPDSAAWGVLAQAGAGGVFWLSERCAAVVELLGIARQTNAVIEDSNRGDYLMQINDTHALLLIGFGMTIGDP